MARTQYKYVPVSQDSGGSGGGYVVLATASYDGTIRLWEAHSGVCWKVIQTQEKVQVNKLAISPNKTYIAGACTQRIRLWDVSSTRNEAIRTFDGHVGNVTAIGFQRSGRWLYSAGEDGSIRVWDLRTSRCEICFWNETATGAVGTRGGPEPTTFGGGAPAAAARAAELAEAATGTAGATAGTAAGAQGGKKVAAAGVGAAADVSAPPRAPLHYGGGQCHVYCAELHPNQGEIASGDAAGSVRVWDLVAGKCRAELRPDKGTPVSSLAYARDASLLVAGCFDGTVYAWQPPEGSRRSSLPPEGGAGGAASAEGTSSLEPAEEDLTGGGGAAGGGAESSEAKKADHPEGAEDGAGGYTPVKRVRAHRSYVLSTRVSPSLRLAATASADKTVRLWSLPDWTRVTTLTGHSKWVWDVAFSNDSQYLVTASSDGQTRLWDASGDTLLTYSGHERAVCCVAMHDADAVLE